MQKILNIYPAVVGSIIAVTSATLLMGKQAIWAWVDEKAGLVMCLSQAADSSKVISTHKEAHGLMPAPTLKVKQGE